LVAFLSYRESSINSESYILLANCASHKPLQDRRSIMGRKSRIKNQQQPGSKLIRAEKPEKIMKDIYDKALQKAKEINAKYNLTNEGGEKKSMGRY
jgi:hypothetical protein